jgi:CDP-diacylglycerol--glycerol-3-phosphate 3-phosphatidyltransferase
VKITANAITLTRISLTPLPTFLIFYGSKTTKWIGFIIFIFLGITDFIDGYLARKNGITSFGSLIDPIADKIFILAIIFSLSNNGIFPIWLSLFVISRELLITIFRSSISFKEKKIKTPILAKLKTIIQMGGFGTIFLTASVSGEILISIILLLIFSFLILIILLISSNRKIPYYIFPVFTSSLFVIILKILFSSNFSILIQSTILILITWSSSFQYISNSLIIFNKCPKYYLYDIIKIFWLIFFSTIFIPTSISIISLSFISIFVISLDITTTLISNSNILTNKKNINFYFLISSILIVLAMTFLYTKHLNLLKFTICYPILFLTFIHLLVFSLLLKKLPNFYKIN